MMTEDEVVTEIRMMHYSQRDNVARYIRSMQNVVTSNDKVEHRAASCIPKGLINVESSWNEPMTMEYEEEVKALVAEILRLREEIKLLTK